MKKILITGASGFIGSHLTERCLALGHHVTGFVRYNSTGLYPWLQSIQDHPHFKMHRGDIRDHDSVSRAIAGCDTVLHLAALIGIPYSYESPLAYIRTNIEGTYNVLENARIHGCPNVIITSTSETYGSAQYVPIDENHPAVGQSPYAATKIGADQISLSYFRSFNLGVKIIRPFNTYGPRQSARAVIPTVITQILAGKKHLALGNLQPTRDLTFVTDTVEGFLAVAGSDACLGEAINLGVQTEISIGNLVQEIARIMKTDISIESEALRLRPDASEVTRLLSDNSKVRALTGWRPQYDLSRGLEATIEWMRINQSMYGNKHYST